MEMFVTLKNSSLGSIILETAGLILLFIILGWIATVLFIQKNRMRELSYRHRLNLSMLYSASILMFVFAIYFTIVLVLLGKHSFNWAAFPMDIKNTYYLLLPQIVVFISLLAFWIIKSIQLKKELKK